MHRLESKKIAIIGASGDLGSYFSQKFHDEGALVILASRSYEKLKALEAKIGEGEVFAFQTDASSSKSVEKLFQEIFHIFHRLDAVIVTVGKWKQVSFEDEPAEAERLARLHHDQWFTPILNVGNVAERYFRKQGQGRIIHISSQAAVRPELPGNNTYGPYKAAASRYMEGLSHHLNDVKADKVKAVDIILATVNSPKNAPLLTEEKKKGAVQLDTLTEEIIQAIVSPNPPQRIELKSDSIM